jgi:AAHS family 4-hydroxybenzoate transporter-like MFS transporter
LLTIAKEAGLSTANAVLAGTALQVGGTIGTPGHGQLIDRSSSAASCCHAGCGNSSLIGRPDAAAGFPLFVTIFIAGFAWWVGAVRMP